jgi:hypothetical protein
MDWTQGRILTRNGVLTTPLLIACREMRAGTRPSTEFTQDDALWADDLLRRASAVTLLYMKCRLITLIVMLAIGLQGSVVAFAGTSSLMAHCQTSAGSHPNASQDCCCPGGQHTMSCCLDACMGTIAGVVTTTPQALNWLGSAALLPQFLSIRFSSRGVSPLIRPPIL